MHRDKHAHESTHTCHIYMHTQHTCTHTPYIRKSNYGAHMSTHTCMDTCTLMHTHVYTYPYKETYHTHIHSNLHTHATHIPTCTHTPYIRKLNYSVHRRPLHDLMNSSVYKKILTHTQHNVM